MQDDYPNWNKIYARVHRVARMHNRYVRYMDKNWKEVGGSKPHRELRGWRPSSLGAVWTNADADAVRLLAATIEREGIRHFGTLVR